MLTTVRVPWPSHRRYVAAQRGMPSRLPAARVRARPSELSASRISQSLSASLCPSDHRTLLSLTAAFPSRLSILIPDSWGTSGPTSNTRPNRTTHGPACSDPSLSISLCPSLTLQLFSQTHFSRPESPRRYGRNLPSPPCTPHSFPTLPIHTAGSDSQLSGKYSTHHSSLLQSRCVNAQTRWGICRTN